MVMMMRPSEWSKPAESAAALPKLRRSRTSLTRGSRCAGLAHPRRRAVARAVVDEDDLEALPQPLEHRRHALGQLAHRLRLVEHRHQHADVELRHRLGRGRGAGRRGGGFAGRDLDAHWWRLYARAREATISWAAVRPLRIEWSMLKYCHSPKRPTFQMPCSCSQARIRSTFRR